MEPRVAATTPQELGRLLKQARRRAGLSQEQLAQNLGTNQAYISELESGKESLALTRVFDFMRATGIRMTIETSHEISGQEQALKGKHESVVELCLKYGLAELTVFGSVARGTAHPTSDIDFLYTLKPEVQLGWAINDLSDELASLLGYPVDLVSKKSLHPALRDEALSQTVVIYAA